MDNPTVGSYKGACSLDEGILDKRHTHHKSPSFGLDTSIGVHVQQTLLRWSDVSSCNLEYLNLKRKPLIRIHHILMGLKLLVLLRPGKHGHMVVLANNSNS